MPVAKLFTIFTLAACLATSPFSAGSAQKSLSDPEYNAQVKREAAERNAREQERRERTEARKEDERRDKADRQRKDDEREAKKRERDQREAEERAAKRKRDDEKRAQDKRSDNEAQAKKDTLTSSSPSRSELKPVPGAKRDASKDDKSPSGSTSPATASRAQHTDFFSIDEIRAMSPEERTRLTTFQPVDLDRHLAGRQRNDVRNYVFTGDANNAPRSGTGASQMDASAAPQNSQQPTRVAPPTQQVSPPVAPRPVPTQTPREAFGSPTSQDRIASMSIEERAAFERQYGGSQTRPNQPTMRLEPPSARNIGSSVFVTGSTHANSTPGQATLGTGYSRSNVGAMAKEGGKLAYTVVPWLIPELKAVQVLKAVSTAERGNTVYVAYKNGKPIYVGITNDLRRRVREHSYADDIEVRPIEGLTDLTRSDARSVEQVLIEKHGMLKDGGQLINQRNSISPHRDIYQESTATGANLLRDAKWPGF